MTESATAGEPDEAPSPELRIDRDVHRVTVGDREIILVGTAHVSRSSVETVERVLADERPDRVCVELDPQRYRALSEGDKWEALDLREVLRRKQLATLLVNLLLASYQRRIGLELGVEPGAELLAATRTAERLGIPFELSDRDVRVTLRRASRSISWFRKIQLMSEIVAGLLSSPEVTEEQLEELKEQDALTGLLDEIGRELPALKTALIDERDAYLAEKIRSAEGRRIVAVVGAGHVAGIRRTLEDEADVDLAALEVIPPPSPVWKILGWGIPALIVGSLLWLAWAKGPDVAGENLLFWVLVNGIPCGLGALAALAHPLTVLAAVVSAPFTSLTPVIGAGYVTAFVQAWVRPPRIHELKTVVDDVAAPRGWWSNRLLRILLAFVLPTIGSAIGTYLGGAKILSALF